MCPPIDPQALPPPQAPSPRRSARLLAGLESPVDAASIVAFRVIFGLMLLWEVGRYLHPSANWLEHFYLEPRWLFGYWPFEWIKPLPAPWLQLGFGLVGLAALCLALGVFYRYSAVLLCLGFCYLFLLDKARYLNHLYLVCLLAGLMVLVPAGRLWSVDALRNPASRSRTVPAWSLWILRFQLAMPYVFGGIAKLNADWMRGNPLRDWLSYRGDFPLLGQWFETRWMVMGMAWGGLLLDLLLVPLLFWRRTRAGAFLAALIFHLINARLFSIGIFPWLMICATTIFLPPSWPRQLARALRHGPSASLMLFLGGAGWLAGAFLPGVFLLPQALAGAFGGLIVGFLLVAPRVDEVGGDWPAALDTPVAAPAGSTLAARGLFAFLGVWVALQIWLPLRHLGVPGNVHWTEEGHRYAWHMKLRDKDARAQLFIEDRHAGEVWPVDNVDYLSPRQESKMAARPDMLVQFARYLRHEQEAAGRRDVRVRAEVYASLNGRPEQPLVDPRVDLSRVAWPWWGHADWILALEAGPEAGTTP